MRRPEHRLWLLAAAAGGVAYPFLVYFGQTYSGTSFLQPPLLILIALVLIGLRLLAMRGPDARPWLIGLAIAARPAEQEGHVGRPGLRGASLELDASERGGSARLAVHEGEVELPGGDEDAHAVQVRRGGRDERRHRAEEGCSLQNRGLQQQERGGDIGSIRKPRGDHPVGPKLIAFRRREHELAEASGAITDVILIELSLREPAEEAGHTPLQDVAARAQKMESCSAPTLIRERPERRSQRQKIALVAAGAVQK